MAADTFDFEYSLEPEKPPEEEEPPDLPAEVIGQQPGNFKKNYRRTVCTYWLRGLCMKGDQCGFLHQFDPERMPVCRELLKNGKCTIPDCPYKHDMEEVKECNMYKLGFCIYGPQCRYRHVRHAGPPPDVSTVEAAKPREHRNLNLVINSANPGTVDHGRPFKRGRMEGGGRGRPPSLPSNEGYQGRGLGQPLALTAGPARGFPPAHGYPMAALPAPTAQAGTAYGQHYQGTHPQRSLRGFPTAMEPANSGRGPPGGGQRRGY